jgi:DNA-directed RNA polymerase subunit M/transcription elongation factor TFIIS
MYRCPKCSGLMMHQEVGDSDGGIHSVWFCADCDYATEDVEDFKPYPYPTVLPVTNNEA